MGNNNANLSIAAIRSVTLDVINKANSGHPGMALDATPAVYALFHDHLVADPTHPNWINRDRFVLSSGHVSALLYTLLHCAGYKISVEDLKSFRQCGSLTPGHPEVGLTSGVDATSGPLGQGIAQAVGMAIAEKTLSAQYPDSDGIMSHYTYVLCGDGCLEEGVSHEAINLAGHYGLNKLILLYDENESTLDGPTSDSATDNVDERFLAAEWNVIEVKDGNSYEAMSKAIGEAKLSKNKPTIIHFHTQIGYGSELQGSHKTHGAPLALEDTAQIKKRFGYDKYQDFEIDRAVYNDFKDSFAKRGEEAFAKFESSLNEYKEKHPEDYTRFIDAFSRNLKGYLPQKRDFDQSKAEATRVSSGKYLERLFASMPFTFGGSADVAGSTKTTVKGSSIFSKENPSGRDVHWGIREFGMASATNGIMLHGGLVSYCSTFFVFSDYLKPALRMAAMEHLPVIYLFTHDSLSVGEDGATHEPIEQLAMLRAIPNFDVIRPADINETEGAFEEAVLSSDHPTALILTRQNVAQIPSTDKSSVKFGAYSVYKPNGKLDGQIIATGSEVSLAINAAKLLSEKGLNVEVISMPSMYRFNKLPKEMQDEILSLPYDRRISLEMASTFGWGKYAKNNIGIDTFGLSGKEKDLLLKFGFTPEQIASKVEAMLK